VRVIALLRCWPVTGPQRCTLDVFLLLTRQDHVLLALRQGTGFADGQWNLPSGKAEAGESAVAAVIREAREEIGIQLTEDEVNFAATVHCRNSDTDSRVGLFFQANARQSPLGAPYNAEPHKCAKIAWYPMTMLPATTMPYSALGVSLYQRKASFGTTGW
jgi:8-oxo-dGTP diphosphatase